MGGPLARPVMVRVNAVETAWHAEDMRAVIGLPGLAGIMLPKAEAGETMRAVGAHCGPAMPLVGLIETVAGYFSLRSLGPADGLSRLAFGSVDFCLDSGIRGTGAELDAVRTELVLVSRKAGLCAPVEGVTLAVDAAPDLAADIDRARSFGFGGKLCIHPRQVEAVNRGFSPSRTEIEWAERVMAASRDGAGATTVDGKLVDRPVIAQARAILAEA